MKILAKALLDAVLLTGIFGSAMTASVRRQMQEFFK